MLSLMSTSTINPGDYYLSMRLFKFETLARAFASTCKIENLKIVRNGHQHTKTTEDEEVFWINAYKKFLRSLGFLL